MFGFSLKKLLNKYYEKKQQAAKNGVQLLASILVCYSEISSLSYEPKNNELVLDFVVKGEAGKKELQDFRERETPKKVIVSAWNPDKCPCCHDELSESLGDGYYSHPTFLERCPKCLQKLVWDE